MFEPFTHLRHGEHTTIPQTIITRKKAIRFLDIPYVHPRERLAVDRMHAFVAQDGGDLTLCILVEQPVYLGYDVRRVLAQFANWRRKRP